ncbi:MAG TPA: hypothetical protein VF068_03915 [Rubrobacter sp.]
MSASRALALGAISGLRSLSGPAFVSHGHLDLEGTPLAFLGSPRLSKALVLMALGELVGDKLSITPSRTSPPVLLWRAVSGGLVGGASFVSEGRRATRGVVLGSSSAIAAAIAGERLRDLAGRKTGLPDPLLALAEDAVVLVVGFRLLSDVR